MIAVKAKLVAYERSLCVVEVFLKGAAPVAEHRYFSPRGRRIQGFSLAGPVPFDPTHPPRAALLCETLR
jgi:hypothetical protein